MENIFRNQFGEIVEKPADRPVVFRPSAYAVVINNRNELLVAKSGFDGRFLFPGGGIEVGESIADCITRECREETGYHIVADQSPRYFRETMFHNKINDNYYHVVGLFFFGRVLDAINAGQIEDTEEIASVEWVDLANVKEEDWGHYCWPIVKQLITDVL